MRTRSRVRTRRPSIKAFENELQKLYCITQRRAENKLKRKQKKEQRIKKRLGGEARVNGKRKRLIISREPQTKRLRSDGRLASQTSRTETPVERPPADPPADDGSSHETFAAYRNARVLELGPDGRVVGPPDAIKDLDGLRVMRGSVSTDDATFLLREMHKRRKDSPIINWGDIGKSTKIYICTKKQLDNYKEKYIKSLIRTKASKPLPLRLRQRFEKLIKEDLDMPKASVITVQPNFQHGVFPLHRDQPDKGGFGDNILTMQASGEAWVVFQTMNKARNYKVYLRPGDAYLMNKHARWDMMHGVLSCHYPEFDVCPFTKSGRMKVCRCRCSVNVRFDEEQNPGRWMV